MINVINKSNKEIKYKAEAPRSSPTPIPLDQGGNIKQLAGHRVVHTTKENVKDPTGSHNSYDIINVE